MTRDELHQITQALRERYPRAVRDIRANSPVNFICEPVSRHKVTIYGTDGSFRHVVIEGASDAELADDEFVLAMASNDPDDLVLWLANQTA
jgi:hypothetical protein